MGIFAYLLTGVIAGLKAMAGVPGLSIWPVALAITAASVLFAPLGARLAHTLLRETLRWVFAVLLRAIGLKMILAV